MLLFLSLSLGECSGRFLFNPASRDCSDCQPGWKGPECGQCFTDAACQVSLNHHWEYQGSSDGFPMLCVLVHIGNVLHQPVPYMPVEHLPEGVVIDRVDMWSHGSTRQYQ